MGQGAGGLNPPVAAVPTDRAGLHCPMGSHIRRANPRDGRGEIPEVGLRLSKRHRIMRRGRLYGPPPANDTFQDDRQAGSGLLFMCLNADIAQQFEFVQQTWLNNGFFGGLTGEVDPIAATVPAGGDMYRIQARPAAKLVPRTDPIVSVRGGAYFFMPGLRALRRIADNRWS